MREFLRRQPAWSVVLGYLVWVTVMFIAAQFVVGGVVFGLISIGLPLEIVNSVVGVLVISVASYGLALGAVLWLPRQLFGASTNLKELGLSRLPKWLDLGVGPLTFIPYFLVAGVMLSVISKLLPGINWAQKQELGFSTTLFGAELGVAFLLLVIIAPLVEETLFRGYLFGKVRRRANLVASCLLVSLVFGVLHMQVNVAIDTFVLSMALCLLREFTGSIWAGVLLHMVKNGVAFYFLFINPSALSTMGIL